jgi:hypothetical protein
VQESKALALEAGPDALDLVHQLVATRPASSTIILCAHREVLVDVLPALATSSR